MVVPQRVTVMRYYRIESIYNWDCSHAELHVLQKETKHPLITTANNTLADLPTPQNITAIRRFWNSLEQDIDTYVREKQADIIQQSHVAQRTDPLTDLTAVQLQLGLSNRSACHLAAPKEKCN